MAITNIAFTITAAGRAAAINAAGIGLSLSLTHMSLGTATTQRVETTLVASGSTPGDGSLRMTALFPPHTPAYAATVAGLWAGNPASGGILFASWTGDVVSAIQRGDVQYIAALGLTLSSVPAGSVTVTVDPDAAEMLAIMSVHEGATDPHTGYVRKAGSTMTGSLVLSGDASAALNPVPLQQMQAADTATAAAATAALAAHAALRDPHHNYVTPPGMVADFYAASAPNGWVEAAGALLNRSAYPELWIHAQMLASAGALITDAAWVAGTPDIRTAWSLGNGTSTFRVPDLRGMFKRAWSHGRGIDSGRALGSYQVDAIQNINGTVGIVSGGHSGDGAFAVDGPSVSHITAGVSGTDPGLTFDASRVARTADETRPKSIALLTCISTGRVGVVDATGPIAPPADVGTAPAPTPPPPPPSGVAPVASFTQTSTGGEEPWTIAFTDTSINTPTAWAWNFGDGQTSTLANPVNTFVAGTYTVSLTVTNATGTDSASIVVTITGSFTWGA